MNEKEKALLDALIALCPAKECRVVLREAYIATAGPLVEFLVLRRKGFNEAQAVEYVMEQLHERERI